VFTELALVVRESMRTDDSTTEVQCSAASQNWQPGSNMEC